MEEAPYPIMARRVAEAIQTQIIAQIAFATGREDGSVLVNRATHETTLALDRAIIEYVRNETNTQPK